MKIKTREESMEEEVSDENLVADYLEDEPEAPEDPNLFVSDQTLISQSETSLLKMMEKMNQFMGQPTKTIFPRITSRAPEFKT
ncbi:hypothetical protein O181_033486 [Austropuccinia psidii MF-1]|uniref:Uncharacterized protein n=1 Tax=Austropuccinia psidii MF-1 TaxID=1389203 RepID=A0A9Q3CYV3_9BASI|nr:hypothetical protein [Austropuccinia psidii MF-1]